MIAYPDTSFLYALYRRRIVRRKWAAVVLVAIGVALFVGANGSPDRRFLSPVRAIRYGLPAALICWGFVSLERVMRLHPVRWLERLGDISYSLYLSHVFTVGACAAILARGSPMARWGAGLALSAMLAAALLGAELCYRWIELPARRALRGRLGARMVVAATLRDPSPTRG